MRLHQPLREFLPDALGDQIVGFARAHHALHQLHRLGRHFEAEARRKSVDAQDSHRVFTECLTDVPQELRLQVLRATEGIDELAVLTLRHRVDREVAAPEVLFQRYFGRGIDLEALVAAAAFALGPGERVFLVCRRMQEDREILADRLGSERDHLFRGGADHDMISIAYRQAQQFVPDRAPYDVRFQAYGSSAATNSFSRRPASHHSRTAASFSTARAYASAGAGSATA